MDVRSSRGSSTKRFPLSVKSHVQNCEGKRREGARHLNRSKSCREISQWRSGRSRYKYLSSRSRQDPGVWASASTVERTKGVKIMATKCTLKRRVRCFVCEYLNACELESPRPLERQKSYLRGDRPACLCPSTVSGKVSGEYEMSNLDRVPFCAWTRRRWSEMLRDEERI